MRLNDCSTCSSVDGATCNLHYLGLSETFSLSSVVVTMPSNRGALWSWRRQAPFHITSYETVRYMHVYDAVLVALSPVPHLILLEVPGTGVTR